MWRFPILVTLRLESRKYQRVLQCSGQTVIVITRGTTSTILTKNKKNNNGKFLREKNIEYDEYTLILLSFLEQNDRSVHISHSKHEVKAGVPELLGKGRGSNFYIIWKPSDSLLFKIDAHSDHRFVLQSQLSCYFWIVASGIYSSPEGDSYKMFAIDIGVVFEETVAETYYTVLRRRVDFYFEVYLPLFLNFMGTINKNEVVGGFDEFLFFVKVGVEVWGLFVGVKMEDLAVLMAFGHWIDDPLGMSLILEGYPVNVGFGFEDVLEHDFICVGIDVFCKDFIQFWQSVA